MDTNGLPIEGFPSTNLPLGLGAAAPLPADMSLGLVPEVPSVSAGTAYVNGGMVADAAYPQTNMLTEAEKEQRLFERLDEGLKNE